MNTTTTTRLYLTVISLVISSFHVVAQCTISGSGTKTFSTLTCIETGVAPVSGSEIIIPFGVTLRTSSNGQNLGSFDIRIEDGGEFLINHNNVSLDGNIIIEDGGRLQIDGKINLSCGSAIGVQSGGEIFTGSSSGASERLSICGDPIIQGGGNCDPADGSGDTDPPYCAGGGIIGPTGFDETGEVPGVLPVVLLSFQAVPTDEAVMIRWSTAVEERNAYFQLENSKDGKEYTTVTKMDGAGNSTSLQRYEFLDNQPYTGVSYYRLIQVDTDDTRTIYGPVRVDRVTVGDLTFFPNPLKAGNPLTILRSSENQGDLNVHLRDVQGRVIITWKISGGAGENVVIPPSILSGIYVLEVTAGADTKSYRVVIE
jgi:hypothetical protein